nr:MAG TPA: hypothetical protein [Caudoviricetes sp.]
MYFIWYFSPLSIFLLKVDSCIFIYFYYIFPVVRSTSHILIR